MATQIARSMISEVSICNQALTWVGASTINSLDDPSTEAEWCNNNYPFLRDSVLEERMWTFAIDRIPSTSQDLTAWGGLFKHRLPEEWLNVYRVYIDEAETQIAKWTREDEYVVSSSPTIYMWGVKRNVDTGKFSNLFAQALASRLAADAALYFTQNKELAESHWQLYVAKLNEAAVRDRQGRNDFVNEICELALSWLNQERIVTTDEQWIESERLRANYETARDTVLQERMWTFATVRAVSTATLKSEFGDLYLHDIPEDWLQVFRVYEDANQDRYAEFVVEGSQVLTKKNTAYLWGIKRITDISLFPPMFKQLIAAKLAADLCYTFTKEIALIERMWNIYQLKLNSTSVNDGKQGSSEVKQYQDTRLITTR